MSILHRGTPYQIDGTLLFSESVSTPSGLIAISELHQRGVVHAWDGTANDVCNKLTSLYYICAEFTLIMHKQ